MAGFSHPKVVIVSKLRQKDLGNPRMAAALQEGDPRVVWIGTILGKATNVKRFVDPQDETKVSYALVGNFEGQPTNLDVNGNPVEEKYQKPVLRSGVCWLPGGLHDLVVEAVTNGDPLGKGPRNVVPFRVKIGTRRAQNAAGYEYVNEIESEITSGADPLAELRQLEAPKPATRDGTFDMGDETAIENESASERADAEDAHTKKKSRRS